MIRPEILIKPAFLIAPNKSANEGAGGYTGVPGHLIDWLWVIEIGLLVIDWECHWH